MINNNKYFCRATKMIKLKDYNLIHLLIQEYLENSSNVAENNKMLYKEIRYTIVNFISQLFLCYSNLQAFQFSPYLLTIILPKMCRNNEALRMRKFIFKLRH